MHRLRSWYAKALDGRDSNAGDFGRLQGNPAPPSEKDAKAIWENSNKQLGLEKVLKLVDLKKTDGQFAKVNGVTVYTLFFDARRQHLTSVGHWKPGDVETVHSNYGFQKTENGWQGPDGTHFDH